MLDADMVTELNMMQYRYLCPNLKCGKQREYIKYVTSETLNGVLLEELRCTSCNAQWVVSLVAVNIRIK